jgi:hypothetical protein
MGEEVTDDMGDEVDQPVRQVKYGMSEVHNLGGKGSNMVIT